MPMSVVQRFEQCYMGEIVISAITWGELQRGLGIYQSQADFERLAQAIDILPFDSKAGKMFGKMMPRGADKMGLSKMNFAGMGPKMIKNVMKKHNALTLPQLIEMAQEQDVKLVACTMTMDLLGLQEKELLDNIEYAGVAAYLADAENGNVNLFI